MTVYNIRLKINKWVQGVSGLTDNMFTPDKLEFKKDANMLKSPFNPSP